MKPDEAQSIRGAVNPIYSSLSIARGKDQWLFLGQGSVQTWAPCRRGGSPSAFCGGRFIHRPPAVHAGEAAQGEKSRTLRLLTPCHMAARPPEGKGNMPFQHLVLEAIPAVLAGVSTPLCGAQQCLPIPELSLGPAAPLLCLGWPSSTMSMVV